MLQLFMLFFTHQVLNRLQSSVHFSFYAILLNIKLTIALQSSVKLELVKAFDIVSSKLSDIRLMVSQSGHEKL